MNNLSILLVKDFGNQWVAQCLEHDIAAQGSSIAEAISAFHELFVSELLFDIERQQQPLSDIKPAPGFYWKKYAEEAERIDFLRSRPFRLDPLVPNLPSPTFEMRAA